MCVLPCVVCTNHTRSSFTVLFGFDSFDFFLFVLFWWCVTVTAYKNMTHSSSNGIWSIDVNENGHLWKVHTYSRCVCVCILTTFSWRTVKFKEQNKKCTTINYMLLLGWPNGNSSHTPFPSEKNGIKWQYWFQTFVKPFRWNQLFQMIFAWI